MKERERERERTKGALVGLEEVCECCSFFSWGGGGVKYVRIRKKC